ncbi:hypothetical protein MBLNU13_g09813t2 [Cladosporium sp. NU13]
MDYQTLLAGLLVVFILAAIFLIFCYTPLPSKTSKISHSVQLAKWLRVAGAVFALSFAVLCLCHESIGALKTRYFARIILLCNVYCLQLASLLEVTRHYSNPEASVYLGVGAASIVVLNTASIVFAAVPDPTHIVRALARWLPPSSATCIQLPITAIPVWRPKQGKRTALTTCWLTAIFVFANLLSIVPFWISVAIRQESEVAVLGCQVVVLVLFNWPPAFTPPMLAQIRMGPAEDREKFWGRVHWLWPSIRRKKVDNDERRLTGDPSRNTSSASIAQSIGQAF